MNARTTLAIARKDLVDAIRNLYVFSAILFPLGFWLFFRLVLGGSGEVKLGAIAIYDQGTSRLVTQLEADPLVGKLIAVDSLAALTQTVRKDAVGGLALPADFDAAVSAGSSPEVTVLYDGRRGGGELAAFRQLIDNHLSRLANRPPVAQLVRHDVNQSSAGEKPVGFDLAGYSLVLLLVLGLGMTGVFVVPTLLVEEKEKHTLKSILVSPASYADVVAGKALVGVLYTLLGAAILVVLSDGLAGVTAPLALAVVLGGLFTVEVGLLLGAIFSTAAQVNTWSSILLLLLIAPSWLTSISVADAVSAVMRVLPTYYLVQLIVEARGGVAEVAATTNYAVLLASIVALFAAIVWTLRRAER